MARRQRWPQCRSVLSRLTVGFLAVESHVEVLPRDRLDESFHAIRRPPFLLDRLLEAGDVVRVAGLLGEDDQRAVGGDLMILVGVAGVEVLQRLILRERMYGGSDAAGRVGDEFLERRRAVSERAQRLLKTLQLGARDLDVLSKD